ncbi:WhiB family transcriptional regulator [Terrabacter sp. Ter38]|uniref:WhiB family transcriptional regulator n=1 Tax=Terrabacter sp. Ter38 TaxID=2926030 RepID=UPI002117A8C1|nr:WhiB family transcriptional regulator [Terrabacter sp. Ter38]
MRTQTALTALLGRPDLSRSTGPVPRDLASGGWKEYGTCRQTDAELWFADTSRRIHDRAASICHDYPVRRSCLTWALVFDEDFGIWGGLSTAERRPFRARLTRGEPVAAVVGEALTSAPVTAFAPRGEVA